VSNEGLSDNVKQFIAECISSVEQLEVLLHLYATAPRPWSAEAIAKDLYVAPESVQRRLIEFHEKGLLEKREGDLYTFKPVKQETDRTVHEVSLAYKERRVAVINQIFSNPQDHLRSFADAFKFKK
jgi:predicted ArsR family transcriptional regulator